MNLVLSATQKRTIFWSLFAIFIIYNYNIYSSSNGQDMSVKLPAETELGRQLFRDYNCVSCHQFYGLGGYMGPDLTNVISARGKGRNYAASFIKNGTVKMPNFHLTDVEVDALLSYLEHVDSSGQYPLHNPSLTWYGTVDSESLYREE